MSLGPWQIALVVLLLLILFGRGRISEMMGDFGKGISSFKKGLNESDQKDDDVEKPRIADKTEVPPPPPPPATPQTPSASEPKKDDNAS